MSLPFAPQSLPFLREDLPTDPPPMANLFFDEDAHLAEHDHGRCIPHLDLSHLDGDDE